MLATVTFRLADTSTDARTDDASLLKIDSPGSMEDDYVFAPLDKQRAQKSTPVAHAAFATD